MKNKMLLQLLPFIVLLPMLSGCEIIGGIFKTGVGVGIFIVVFILVVIFAVMSRAKK